MILTVNDLHAGYRKLEILHGLNLHVGEGEIVSLIGANGAGKTTTLRALAGILSPSKGSIQFEGRDIGSLRADLIVKAGLVHVPQDRALFGNLNVAENLEMGAYTKRKGSASIKSSLDDVFDLFPILAERRHQRADTLSGGQQQMLAIGRAMMARPRCLTLDEPSVGLAPNLANQVLAAISAIRQTGVSVLVVEQNAKQALGISDRAYVIENGSIVLEGTGESLLEDSRVRDAYLGL